MTCVSEAWTTLKVLEWTTDRFGRAAIPSPRLEAQVLLAHVLACDRVRLYTNFDQPLGEAELAAYRRLIQRRLDGEPVAYLVNEQEFWSLPFHVDAGVLIPRRDTETVIEVILDRIEDRTRPLRIVDIATGSGAIAVTLARELPAAQVVATDLSEAAVRIAARNAARNGVGDRVEVRMGDLLAPVAGEQAGFDIVVSNPPYIPSADIAGLSRDVRCEPRQALDGGADGLDFMRRILGVSAAAPEGSNAGDTSAAQLLRPDGLLVLEHGFDQAERVAGLIASTGAFEPAEMRRDLGDNPRVTHARRLG